MKSLKKVLITGTITIATLIAMSAISKAATVTVTGEVINIRKSASTDSDVVAMLSEGVECEYLGEEGDWYKIKYQRYTGYVSKQYTKLIEDTVDTTQKDEENKNVDNNQNDKQEENKQNTETVDNKDNNQEEVKDENQNAENATNKEQENTEKESNEVKLVYKKFNKNTTIKILPLIHSSIIAEIKKDAEVLVLTETSGWSYVQTDEINGWVRTDTLGEEKTVDTNQTTDTQSEKTGYISEEYVNMRKGAGTSYEVVMILKLNAQVTILGEEGNWYKVKSGNNTGYISKDYVSDSAIVTDRSLTEPRTNKEEEKDDSDKKEETTSSDDKDKSTSKNTTSTSATTNSNTTSNATSNKTNSTTTSTASTTNKVTSTSSNNTTSTVTTNTNATATTTPTTTTTTSSTSNTIKGTDVVAYAKKFLGYKYVWAGDGSNNTFDCSGFTMYVYKHFGVSLPHYTVSQYNSSKGTKITKQSDLQIGDIVFLTDYDTGAAYGHCGIYIGDGKFIHADSSVGYVNISDLNGIYKGRFCGALRVNGVEN